ncbi:restriction endonuclease [Streptococcus anginosus]|uniref:Restriction endonuclease n=2 Tax=Streptococcus anginosus TaxID=1328 RepID=A0A6G4N0E0_STRAP|nr:HIRAN domain-containing protein [Streptococcus anginosus]NGG16718.1 restriction endonuclease [Streptococcus anginosus]NGG24021.1 restriction endonuclease [Streptococcus anginosus]
MGLLSFLGFGKSKQKAANRNTVVQKNRIIYHDEFRLMGTNYHKQEAFAAADYLSGHEHYFGKTDKELKSYMQRTLKPVYKYNELKTIDVLLQREPTNPNDKNAVKVLINNTFVGYLPAEIAKRFSSCIGNPKYRYDAILTGWGGPYKTLSSNLEKIVTREKELYFNLDLTIWHLK